MTDDRRRGDHPRHGDSPPAVATTARVLSRLTDLAELSMRTQLSLAKHSIDLAWATLAGTLDHTSAHKAYLASVTRESARYWREVAQLSADYATDLVALGRCVSTTVLREVAAAGRKPSSRKALDARDHGQGGRAVRLSLEGPVGGRAEGMITVANEFRRARRIQLRAGDLVDAAGVVVGAGLDISPTTVTVPSGQQRTVSLGVDLGDVSILAGHRYSSTVQVRGCGEATIDVSVDAGRLT
jgi:hypothetical protein